MENPNTPVQPVSLPINQPDKRKLIILTIAGGLLAIGFLFLLLNTSSFQKTLQQEKATVPTQISVWQEAPKWVPPTVGDVRIPPTSWPVYQSSGYAMHYPPDWTSVLIPFGEGEGVMLKPYALSEEEVYPSITVYTSVVSGNNTAEFKRDLYKALGYTMKASLLGVVPAEKWFGTVPTKKVGGQTVTSPSQEVVVLAKRGQSLYVVNFKYDGATKQANMEALFDQMLATFKIQ